MNETATKTTPQLTRRQIEIIQRIADGQPDKAIASALGISFATVRFHIGCIMRKLRASDRASAACIYISAP